LRDLKLKTDYIDNGKFNNVNKCNRIKAITLKIMSMYIFKNNCKIYILHFIKNGKVKFKIYMCIYLTYLFFG